MKVLNANFWEEVLREAGTGIFKEWGKNLQFEKWFIYFGWVTLNTLFILQLATCTTPQWWVTLRAKFREWVGWCILIILTLKMGNWAPTPVEVYFKDGLAKSKEVLIAFTVVMGITTGLRWYFKNWGGSYNQTSNKVKAGDNTSLGGLLVDNLGSYGLQDATVATLAITGAQKLTEEIKMSVNVLFKEQIAAFESTIRAGRDNLKDEGMGRAKMVLMAEV